MEKGKIYNIPNYNGTPNYFGDDYKMQPDPYDKYIIIPVSESQGAAMHEKAEKIRVSPGNYNLYEHNCSMVAQSILEAGGKNFTKTNWDGYAKIIRSELANVYADFNKGLKDIKYSLPANYVKEILQNYNDFKEKLNKKVSKYENIGLIPRGAYKIGTTKGYKYGTIKK